MNEYDDNPFFFFMDNPTTFSMDVYPDIGKIIELSDTGCDARAPLTSTRRRNEKNRPYSAKTVYADVSSFRDVFNEKEIHNENQFNVILDKKSKKVPVRDRTVPRNPKRSMDRDNNEKIDQWERNNADFKNTLLRDQVNLLDDSSIENFFEHNPISENSRTYFSNSKNSLPRMEINRQSRKEETNVKNEIREQIPDFAKNSNESRSTPGFSREETSKGKRISSATRSTRVDRQKRRENFEKNNNSKTKEGSKAFTGETRRSIDRAVDKDSLSDSSDMSTRVVTNTNENHENLAKEDRSRTISNKNNIKQRQNLQEKKNSPVEKRSKIFSSETIEIDKDESRERKNLNARLSSQERTKNRAMPQTRAVSKSADFDKAKHRANMAKRYANKSWMKTRQNVSTNEKMGENEISDNSNAKNSDYVQRNDVSRTKAVSKSAGSSTRKREDAETEKTESEKVNTLFSFDDSADSTKKITKTVEDRSSTNRTRITGTPVSNSFRRDEEDNSLSSEQRSTPQSGIQRKDLEKLSAIFLSSTLKRNVKPSFSKLNKNDRESRKERNKSVPTNGNRMENTRLDRISFPRIENDANSKIRPSVSNLSKLPSKTEKWVKSKIPVAISRLKKELEDNRELGEFSSREASSRTKSAMRENELVSNDERIDESTSIGIISIDKTDSPRNEKKEKNEIRSRLDEWSKKLEETRRKERDVELKVFKMAKAQKEERKKEFEKRGFHEPVKKSRKVGKKDIVDIAATMLERESIGKKSHCAGNYNDTRENAIRKELHSKAHSLRSSIYARYFPSAL